MDDFFDLVKDAYPDMDVNVPNPVVYTESPVTDVFVQEMKLKPEDISLSFALSSFNKYDESTKIAVWNLFSQPSPALCGDLKALCDSSIISRTIRGDVTPIACLAITEGSMGIADYDEKDSAYLVLQKTMHEIADVPVDVLRQKGNVVDIPLRRLPDYDTIFTHAFVLSCISSIQRLINRNVDDWFTADKLLKLDALGFSFSKFKMIEDVIEVIPSAETGMDVYVPGQPELSASLRVKAPWLSDPLKRPFDNERFKIWSMFCESMESMRPGFKKMVICLMRPRLIQEVLDYLFSSEDKQADDADCGLVDAAVALFDRNLPPPDATLLIDNAIKELNEVKVEKSYELLALAKDDSQGYGSVILDYLKDTIPPSASWDLFQSNMFKDQPETKAEMDLAEYTTNVVLYGELNRIVRAQGDPERDEMTNDAANPFIDVYEDRYASLWKKATDGKKHIYTNVTSYQKLPYSSFTYTKTTISELSRQRFTPDDACYIDLVWDKFDSSEDTSIPTFRGKTWMKGIYYPYKTIALINSLVTLVEVYKRSEVPIVIKINYLLNAAFIRAFSKLASVVPMNVFPPKKAHDPFFYIALGPQYHMVDIMTAYYKVFSYFVRGVHERQRLWEIYDIFGPNRYYFWRYGQWRNAGLEIGSVIIPSQGRFARIVSSHKKVRKNKGKQLKVLQQQMNTLMSQAVKAHQRISKIL